ncbi:MAG: response regulator transcription factor [Candidatus Levybacteria bacterium]|nr:response regulator transcription factor [Candidatus Levybacteria bacterium]
MKILLIDDDEALLTVFGTALQKAGYEITTASDGATGIEKAKNGTFDLLLIDQILPDMRGNDIVKAIKAEEKIKNTPVMILSNFGQTELIKEALDFGAVEYILKYQIEPSDLVTKVKAVLKDKAPTETKTSNEPVIGQQ